MIPRTFEDNNYVTSVAPSPFVSEQILSVLKKLISMARKKFEERDT